MIPYFNPRSRKGATIYLSRFRNPFRISIHAPARERPGSRDPASTIPGFQSTLPQGSDGDFSSLYSIHPHFNPRSRKGANRSCTRTGKPWRFQSTLPQGSDKCHAVPEKGLFRFQSTLPQGSDDPVWTAACHVQNFNPRSRKGATAARSVAARPAWISIHAPARERHRLFEDGQYISVISIHAPARERQSSMSRKRKSVEFQSTLPQGSDCKIA